MFFSIIRSKNRFFSHTRIPVSYTTHGLDYGKPKSPYTPLSSSETLPVSRVGVEKVQFPSVNHHSTPFQMMKLPLTQLLAPLVGKGPAKKIAHDMEGLLSLSTPPFLPTQVSLSSSSSLSPSSPSPSLNLRVLDQESLSKQQSFRIKATVSDPAAIVKVEVLKSSNASTSLLVSLEKNSSSHQERGNSVKMSHFIKQREVNSIPLPDWVDPETLTATSISNGHEIIIEAKTKKSLPTKMLDAVPITSSISSTPSEMTTPPEWKDGWMIGP
jgi:hypothetical protein